MLALVVAVQSWWLTRTPPDRSERGQAAAEYALVLLGAAAVALLVTKWAGKTDRVGKLFDAVFDQVLGKAR
ncbi:MAG TPA: hypothetical protein VM938_09770 [Acidimicrobiales bacterium]|nr:hypothetical protein [Acidimicrobiales bacterium]